MRRFLAPALVAAVTIMACKSERAPASDTQQAASAGRTTAAATAPVTQSAGVKITSPDSGATTGADVTVKLHAEGVTIAKADGKRVEGIGHYHLFLDTVPSPDNVPIPPTSSKIIHIGTGDSTYTFKGLAAGPHKIIAVIGYGDHSPMPVRRDSVSFTVKR